MPTGPNQHYLPRFLQKPFGIRPKRKEIWVFARNSVLQQKRLKEVGSSDHFYADPVAEGERTLDDEITEIETSISRMLSGMRAQPIGSTIDSTNAAEIVNHLVPRTAHVRVSMERGLRMMADGVQTILNDDERLQTLMGLDGMVFPSVQRKGDRANVVLFNHASKVAQWELPDGTRIDASTFDMDENGGEFSYHVSEIVPLAEGEDEKPRKRFEDLDELILKPVAFDDGPADMRADTLSLGPKSLHVHHIESVSFGTTDYDVTRYRRESGKLPF